MNATHAVSRLSALALAATVAAAAPPTAAAGPRKPALDTARIEQLTGAKGQLDEKEGVFEVSVPRDDLQPTVAGMRLPTAMGLTAWAAFQGSPAESMVMGDLVLAEDQVNPVMSVPLENGLEVTALHDHFFWEKPRVMFMHIGGPRVLFLHYWGVGPAQELARGLRAALDRTATHLGMR